MSANSVSTTQSTEEGTHNPLCSVPMLWVTDETGVRPLPHIWTVPWLVVPTMQCLHWETGRYAGSVTESRRVPIAASHTVKASSVESKGKWPDRSTPTPSECEEITDGYQEAFDFWLVVQFKTFSEKKYNAKAEYFDELPGVSGYFRFLCLHTLSQEGDAYVLRRTH